jgi:hypothetical protein
MPPKKGVKGTAAVAADAAEEAAKVLEEAAAAEAGNGSGGEDKGAPAPEVQRRAPAFVPPPAETAAQRTKRLKEELQKAEENKQEETYRKWIQKFGARFQPDYKPNSKSAESSNEKMNIVEQRRLPSKKVKRISKSQPRGKGSARIYKNGLANEIVRKRMLYIKNVGNATRKLRRSGKSYANFIQSVATNSDQFKRLKAEYDLQLHEKSRLDGVLKERNKEYVTHYDPFVKNYGVKPSEYLKSEISKGKAPELVAVREKAERLIKYREDTAQIKNMLSELEKELSRIEAEIENKTERLKKALTTVPASMRIRLLPKNILNAEKTRKQKMREEKAAAARKAIEEAKKKEEENIQKRAEEV